MALHCGGVDYLVTLAHLKNRHGELNSLMLEFDKPHQCFQLFDAMNAGMRKVQ